MKTKANANAKTNGKTIVGKNFTLWCGDWAEPPSPAASAKLLKKARAEIPGVQSASPGYQGAIVGQLMVSKGVGPFAQDHDPVGGRRRPLVSRPRKKDFGGRVIEHRFARDALTRISDAARDHIPTPDLPLQNEIDRARYWGTRPLAKKILKRAAKVAIGAGTGYIVGRRTAEKRVPWWAE